MLNSFPPFLFLFSFSFSYRSFVSSGPEGVDDLYFHTYGKFSPSSPSSPMSSLFQIPALRPKSQLWGTTPRLKDQIAAPRPKSQPQGPNHNPKLKIPAHRPKSQPQSPFSAERSKSQSLEGEGEKASYMWKHRLSTPLEPLSCSLPPVQSQPT